MADPVQAVQRTKSLADIIRDAVSAGLASAHVSMPAKVDRYDAAKQLVDVVPLLMGEAPTAAGGSVPSPVPTIYDVPVVFPGAGPFRLTFPISVGDTVTLLFADRSLNRWKSADPANGPVDPASINSHHLADAIAIPGLRPFSKSLANVPDDTLSIGHDSGARIEIAEDEIDLGENADESVTRFESLKATTDAQVHLGNLGYPTGVPIVPLPSPIGSGLVKVAP